MRTLAFLFLGGLASAQQWTQLSDFPGSKRDDGAVCVVNNKAYFGTGLQEGWTSTTDWHALDLSTYQWSAIPPMPAGYERQYACAFAGLNSFYVFGGDNYGGLTSLLRFDLNNSTWTAMTPKPGKGVIGAACMVFGDKVYFAGGKVDGDSLPGKQFWEYSISANTWKRKTDLPFVPRWRAAACVLGASGYLAGGIGTDKKPIRDFYMFDPQDDIWYPLDSLPGPNALGYASLQAVGNKLLYFGGQDTNNVYNNKCWYFKIVSQTWEAGPTLPSHGRRGGMSVGAGEKFIYACGLGPQDQRLNTAWMLDLPLNVAEATAKELRVFPNPFSDHLVLEIPAHAQVKLTDVLGFLAYESESGLANIPTQHLEKGLYILTVRMENGETLVRKLVKE